MTKKKKKQSNKPSDRSVNSSQNLAQGQQSPSSLTENPNSTETQTTFFNFIKQASVVARNLKEFAIVIILLVSTGVSLIFWLKGWVVGVEPQRAFRVLLFSLSVLWGISIWIYWKTPEVLLWARRPALLLSIAIPFLAIGTYSTNYYWNQRMREKKVVIVLTSFAGPDPRRYRVTETLQVYLEKALLNNQTPGVKIVTVGKSANVEWDKLMQEELAEKLAKKYQAEMVIMGWYGITGSSVEVCASFHAPGFWKPFPSIFRGIEPKIQDILVLDVDEIETFKVQFYLAERMAYQGSLMLGLAYFASGNEETAEAYFNTAQNSIEKGLKELEECKRRGNPGLENELIKLKENKVFLHIFSGHNYLRQKKEDDAISCYNGAIKQTKEIVSYYYKKVNFHYGKSQIDQAEDFEKKTEKQNKRLAKIFNYRAIAYRKKNNFGPAALDFKRVTMYDKTIRPDTSKLNAKNAENLYKRAYEYLRENELVHAEADFTSSIAVFERVLEDRHDLRLAYSLTGLGEVHRRQNRLRDAIEELTKAIQICEEKCTSPKLWSFYARSLRNRGEAYLVEKEFNRAINDQKEALRLYSCLLKRTRERTEQWKKWQNEIAGQKVRLGNIYLDINEPNNASEYYQDAIEKREKLMDKEKPWKLANHLANSRAQKAMWHIKRLKEGVPAEKKCDLAKTEKLLSEAVNGYRIVMEQLEVDPNLVKLLKEEGDADFRDDVANWLTVRGNLLLGQKKWPEAEMVLKEAKAYHLELMRENKEEFEENFMLNLFSLAKAEFNQTDKKPQAKKTYKEAFKVLSRVIEKKGMIWFSEQLYTALDLFLEDSGVASEEKKEYKKDIKAAEKWMTGDRAEEGRQALNRVRALLSEERQ